MTLASALTRRTAASCFGSRAGPTAAVPSVALIRPVSASSRLVRPEPEGPSTAISAPGSASRPTSRKAQPRGPRSPNPSAVTATPSMVSPVAAMSEVFELTGQCKN